MFQGAAAFNSDVSKWNLNAAGHMSLMFENSAFDRTICGDKWLNLNAFENSNGRHGCCNAGSYMSTPHVAPFNATEACATCSDTNAVVSLRNNSDVACPTIQDMVDTWLTDQEAAIAKYGSIENWDTSKVIDMSNLFEGATAFNGGNKNCLFDCSSCLLNFFNNFYLFFWTKFDNGKNKMYRHGILPK